MKIKKCPFCGFNAYIEDDYDEQNGVEMWKVSCDSCWASTRTETSKKEVIKLWNRRQ